MTLDAMLEGLADAGWYVQEVRRLIDERPWHVRVGRIGHNASRTFEGDSPSECVAKAVASIEESP